MDMQQIQFLNADLYTDLKAGEFEEFMYDSEDDSSLNAIKDVIEKAGDLKTATKTVERALNSLASDVYKNKPEVKERFDGFITNLQERNDKITERIDSWCEGIKGFYEDQVESNSELMNDLKTIQDYLDDGSFSDWNK